MAEGGRRLDRLAERNDDARRAKAEIEDWLAGRGALAMTFLLVALVLALVLNLAHV